MRGFSGCSGSIDGTSIKTRALFTQDSNPLDYNTCHNYFGIQLLEVYSSNMLFNYVHIGNLSHVACPSQYRGCCHDHCFIATHTRTGTPVSRADSWILRSCVSGMTSSFLDEIHTLLMPAITTSWVTVASNLFSHMTHDTILTQARE